MKNQRQHIRFASPVGDGMYLWMGILPPQYGRYVLDFKPFE